MEFLPLFVALLGSTGVIGLLTLAIQFSRRARLARAIREGVKATAAVDEGSHSRRVLQQAIEMDVMRLAMTSIVSLRPTFWYFFWGITIAVAVALASAGLAIMLEVDLKGVIPMRSDTRTDALWIVIGLTAFMAYVAIGVLVVNWTILKQRERQVAAQIVKSSPEVVTRGIWRDARMAVIDVIDDQKLAQLEEESSPRPGPRPKKKKRGAAERADSR